MEGIGNAALRPRIPRTESRNPIVRLVVGTKISLPHLELRYVIIADVMMITIAISTNDDI